MGSYGGLAFIVMAIVIGTGWVVDVEFFDDGLTGDLGKVYTAMLPMILISIFNSGVVSIARLSVSGRLVISSMHGVVVADMPQQGQGLC